MGAERAPASAMALTEEQLLDLNDVVNEDRYSRLEGEVVFVIRAKRGKAVTARGALGALRTAAK